MDVTLVPRGVADLVRGRVGARWLWWDLVSMHVSRVPEVVVGVLCVVEIGCEQLAFAAGRNAGAGGSLQCCFVVRVCGCVVRT